MRPTSPDLRPARSSGRASHFYLGIPCNGNNPLKVGDRMQIIPESQDPGDDKFERFAIEAPPNTTQVRIRTTIPGFAIHPTEWIEAKRLVHLSSNP